MGDSANVVYMVPYAVLMQRKVGMMGKKSVVVEIMEKRLSPHGFQYVSYNNLIWTFSREVEGVNQFITIQKSQWENSYALNLL